MAVNLFNALNYIDSIANLSEATRIYQEFMIKMLVKYQAHPQLNNAIDSFNQLNGPQHQHYLNALTFINQNQGQDLGETVFKVMILSAYINAQHPLIQQLAQSVAPVLTEQDERNRLQYLRNDHQECLDEFNDFKAQMMGAYHAEQRPKRPSR